MKHCVQCKMDIAGDFKRCPLCRHTLTGEAESRRFPVINSFYKDHQKGIGIGIMLSGAAIVLSAAVNIVIPNSGIWSIFVILGIICCWTVANSCIKKGKVIPGNIAVNITLIAIICDAISGWKGWSVEYIMPIIFSLTMLTAFIVEKAMKINIRHRIHSGIVYILMFIVIPFILCIFGISEVIIPSVICIVEGAILLIGFCAFHREVLWAELTKKFHL